MTTMKSIGFALALAAATGALGWRLASRRVQAPAAPAAPEVSADEFEALKAHVSSLERMRGREAASAIVAAPAPQHEPQPASAPKPRPAPTEAREQSARNFHHYGDVFAAQPRDAAWAGALEHAVDAVLADKSLSFVRDGRFRCATSMCRLEAQVAGPQEFEDLARTFAEKTTRDLPSGTFRESDDGQGGLTIEAFFAKAGSQLPPVEAVQ